MSDTITRSELKELTVNLSGATAAGIACASPVNEDARRIRRDWIAAGCHAGMDYLEKYEDVRDNPALLLDGAQTIIMAAFSYANTEAVAEMERGGLPLIAEYALGADYHTEVRRRLEAVAEHLKSVYGGHTRVCVDTAPLRERYWAVQAGLGFVGINNYLIIPGEGLHFVLGALLWTGTVSDGPDRPCAGDCGRCGACVRACPTGAISADGRIDARRCLSYLTIESRDPMPAGLRTGNRLFGCDTCRSACPHEPAEPPRTSIEAFVARPEVAALTKDDWMSMTPSHFKRLFRDSAIRRARLEHLRDILSDAQE